MATVLVTGANRGLGLEFVRQYAASGWRVIACCRKPAEADALAGLAEMFPSISTHTLEVADFKQIDALSQALRNDAIDVLIANAAIYSDTSSTRFGALDYRRWLEALVINAQAPVKLAEAFLPQLARSGKKLIVPITSLMGSMGDNNSGGSIIYRSSKAALNAAMKSLAIDLQPQGIGVLIMHPGWVKTDMGGTQAPTAPEQSIAGMRRVIEGFTLSQTGSFVNYRGEVLPW